MRVLLLVTDLQPGGTPLRVVRWASWLRDAGIEPVVGCLAPRGPLHERLEACGIPNFHCDARGAGDFRGITRFMGVIREFEPDIIHSFLFHANVVARLFGRLDRRRPIITSTATVEIERRWHRTIESLTAELSDVHVVNSPRVARHVIDDLGFRHGRVRVVPNGVDIAELDKVKAERRDQWKISSETTVIAWAGRMDPIKRMDLWGEVFDRVRRIVDVAGIWVGDGPRRQGLEALLAQRGLIANGVESGKIWLAGWADRPAAWFKAADIFLLTSDTEGSPNALLEAMACGTPVIASAAGGIVDLVEPGRTGELCLPGDVDGFVDKVVSFCRNPGQRNKLGAVGRQVTVESQGADRVTQLLDEVYRTALRTRL